MVASSVGGLSENDLLLYAKLDGRSGGQILYGGIGSGESLTLNSTSHATKGKIYFGADSAYNEVNNRLGLGTTSPTAAIDGRSASSIAAQLSSDGSIVTFGGTNYSDTSWHQTYFTGSRARGTLASPSAIQANHYMFGLTGRGHDGTTFQNSVSISMQAAENFTGSARGGKFSFSTAIIGGTAVADRMRLDSNSMSIAPKVFMGVIGGTPLGQLHIDQPSTTAAIPVLVLDQADVSEEFIKFIGGTIHTSKSGADEYIHVETDSGIRYIKLYT